MSYDELIKDLRHCATSSEACASCNRREERHCQEHLHAEAAEGGNRMSGIYIPWMSMPKTCDDCQVSADCPNDEHIDGYNMQNRPRFCQLYPVPKHGRLIDADALKDSLIVDYPSVVMAINTAPTIIPADKEGER